MSEAESLPHSRRWSTDAVRLQSQRLASAEGRCRRRHLYLWVSSRKCWLWIPDRTQPNADSNPNPTDLSGLLRQIPKRRREWWTADIILDSEYENARQPANPKHRSSDWSSTDANARATTEQTAIVARVASTWRTRLQNLTGDLKLCWQARVADDSSPEEWRLDPNASDNKVVLHPSAEIFALLDDVSTCLAGHRIAVGQIYSLPAIYPRLLTWPEKQTVMVFSFPYATDGENIRISVYHRDTLVLIRSFSLLDLHLPDANIGSEDGRTAITSQCVRQVLQYLNKNGLQTPTKAIAIDPPRLNWSEIGAQCHIPITSQTLTSSPARRWKWRLGIGKILARSPLGRWKWLVGAQREAGLDPAGKTRERQTRDTILIWALDRSRWRRGHYSCRKLLDRHRRHNFVNTLNIATKLTILATLVGLGYGYYLARNPATSIESPSPTIAPQTHSKEDDSALSQPAQWFRIFSRQQPDLGDLLALASQWLTKNPQFRLRYLKWSNDTYDSQAQTPGRIRLRLYLVRRSKLEYAGARNRDGNSVDSDRELTSGRSSTSAQSAVKPTVATNDHLRRWQEGNTHFRLQLWKSDSHTNKVQLNSKDHRNLYLLELRQNR